jgi:hypothetical protein
MTKAKRCAGFRFGRKGLPDEYGCPNAAGDPGIAGVRPPSDIWCEECNTRRMAHLGGCFEKLRKDLEVRG